MNQPRLRNAAAIAAAFRPPARSARPKLPERHQLKPNGSGSGSFLNRTGYAVRGPRQLSENIGGPGRTQTCNQTVMSGGPST